jgi:5,10-methenyltetrahydrofolate synthetase
LREPGAVALLPGLPGIEHLVVTPRLRLCTAYEQRNDQCQNPAEHHLIMDKSEQKKSLRKRLVTERLALPDRAVKCDMLQRVMRIWLVNRPDTVIGAYWPIKGEFDPLPALHRWKEDGELLDEPQPRRIGLPVVDKVQGTLKFHAWFPGCPMEEDAYGIPKPKETEVVVPTLLFVPCVGYGPGGFRLGYGGGFYDKTLTELQPKPYTVGLGFTQGYVDDLEPEPHDVPLDAILNDNGVVWPIS